MVCTLGSSQGQPHGGLQVWDQDTTVLSPCTQSPQGDICHDNALMWWLLTLTKNLRGWSMDSRLSNGMRGDLEVGPVA